MTWKPEEHPVHLDDGDVEFPDGGVSRGVDGMFHASKTGPMGWEVVAQGTSKDSLQQCIERQDKGW